MWFEIAVNDDVERAKGDGGRVQKGAETMGEAFAEGWKSKVRVPQQLQNRTNRGEHGKERIGGQFAFPWPGKTIVVLSMSITVMNSYIILTRTLSTTSAIVTLHIWITAIVIVFAFKRYFSTTHCNVSKKTEYFERFVRVRMIKIMTLEQMVERIVYYSESCSTETCN